MKDQTAEYGGVYQKISGRGMRMRMKPVVPIMDGTEGPKLLASVTSSNDILVRHSRLFFIKRPNELAGFPETYHDSIIEKYQWLKRGGFPVPPTYRYDPQRREFLITDMRQFGDIHDKHSSPLNQIANRDRIIEEIESIARRAFCDGNGIYLGLDAYSIIVDSENRGHVYLLDLGRGTYKLHEGIDQNGRTRLPQDAERVAKYFIDTVFTPPSLSGKNAT